MENRDSTSLSFFNFNEGATSDSTNLTVGGSNDVLFPEPPMQPAFSSSPFMSGTIGSNIGGGNADDEFENEPPLLEELGINFEHIFKKSMTVLNPLKQIDPHIMDDTDLAGPLFFCLCLGFALLFSGKVHFGYIYGVGSVGCIGLYVLLNLMTPQGVDMKRTVSVLGYCLLPMVFLAILAPIIPASWSYFGLAAAWIVVAWSTYSAAKMFVAVLGLTEHRLLVMYPVGLVYTTFALITIF